MKELLRFLFESTADKSGWFVSLKSSLKGLTEAQALWKPEWSDHSIAGLTAHLHFYQERELNKFRGMVADSYTDNNQITFTPPAPGQWYELVTNTHLVLDAWQEEISKAEAAKQEAASKIVAELTTHLAYHVGQIVLLRKCQGSWDPVNGVQ